MKSSPSKAAGVIEQLFELFILALAVACVAWTVTHEEILREPRDWFDRHANCSHFWLVKKICYVPTCEYCFSHWVAAATVAIADFQLLFTDWRGYFFAWLAVTAISNVFLSAYGHLRVEIRKDRAEIEQTETRTKARLENGNGLAAGDGAHDPKRLRA